MPNSSTSTHEHQHQAGAHGRGEAGEHLAHDLGVAGLLDARAGRHVLDRRQRQHDVASPSPSSAPGAMSALMTTRRSRSKRCDRGRALAEARRRRPTTAAPTRRTPSAPAACSTTDRSSLRLLVELHPDRDLAVADGELGEVGVDVADGGDAQRLRQRRRRNAELGRRCEIGNDDHLGPVERGVRRDRRGTCRSPFISLWILRACLSSTAPSVPITPNASWRSPRSLTK